MTKETTFSEALEAHRKLMTYFGAQVTPEDHKLGALLEALHFLETGMTDQAHVALVSCLKEHGGDGVLSESLMRAENWITLHAPDKAITELKDTLTNHKK